MNVFHGPVIEDNLVYDYHSWDYGYTALYLKINAGLYFVLYMYLPLFDA